MVEKTPPTVPASGAPSSRPRESESPAPPPPATKCVDCGKPFTGYAQTRWDVHLGGGVWKTVCTVCFEKADAKWPEPTPKGKGVTTSKRKR